MDQKSIGIRQKTGTNKDHMDPGVTESNESKVPIFQILSPQFVGHSPTNMAYKMQRPRAKRPKWKWPLQKSLRRFAFSLPCDHSNRPYLLVYVIRGSLHGMIASFGCKRFLTEGGENLNFLLLFFFEEKVNLNCDSLVFVQSSFCTTKLTVIWKCGEVFSSNFELFSAGIVLWH